MLRDACCVLRVACCVLRAACCLLRAARLRIASYVLHDVVMFDDMNDLGVW